MILMPNFSIGMIFLPSVFGLLADVEQARHRRPIDVGIQQPDLQSELASAMREIGRDRRFADAALAAGHRDDRVDAGDAGRRGGGARRGCAGRCACAAS